jgi:hypothetical protein
VKALFVVLALLVASVSASAFEVSETTLNQYVEQKIAEKTNHNLQLLNPKVSLLDGYATFCAKARTKVVASDVDFCANMTPKWRQATGSLLATKIALVSLTAPTVRPQDIEFLKIVLNQLVLPGLEGVEVYKAEDFIGKQIAWMKVFPGKVEMGF